MYLPVFSRGKLVFQGWFGYRSIKTPFVMFEYTWQETGCQENTARRKHRWLPIQVRHMQSKSKVVYFSYRRSSNQVNFPIIPFI